MDTIIQQGFNAADIVILLALAAGFIIGRKMGLVRMALKVVYGVASFGASMIFYPVIAGFVRQTSLFDKMKDTILTTLNLQTAVQTYTKQQEVSMISSLSLPDPLKEKLIENNNSVIYDLIGADSFVDYIAGFVANLLINVVLVWIIFVVFMFLLRAFFKSLEHASRMPVIKHFNHLGGAVMGLTFATLLIWLSFALIYAFIAKPTVYQMYQCIAESKTAVWFYDNNLLLALILKRLF
jgi:hypothetical protein